MTTEKFNATTGDKGGKITGMSIGGKLIGSIAILLAVIITISVFVVYFTMATIMTRTYTGDVKSALDAFQAQIANLEVTAKSNAEAMASDPVTVSSMATGDRTKVALKMNEYKMLSGADVSIVVDETGKVLATSEQKYKSTNLAGNPEIDKALAGTSVASILGDKDTPMEIVAVSPIKNGVGKIAGAIVYMFSLEKESVVDNMKTAANTDCTIFKGDTRVNTTFVENGERQVGTKAADEIVQNVLNGGEIVTTQLELFNKTYMCGYAPLRDVEGNNIGMVFAGKDIDTIIKTKYIGLALSVAIAVVLFALSGLIQAIIIRKLITNPLKKLMVISDNISNGQLGITDKNLKFEITESNDEVGKLSSEMYGTVLNLRKYIGEISRVLMEIGKGNLDIDSDIEYKGDFVAIRDALTTIVGTLKSILGDISIAGEQVAIGSDRVAQGAQELATGSDQQSQEILRLADHVADISERINRTAKTANDATRLSSEAGKGVAASNAQMKMMSLAMQEIDATSDKIRAIIKTIDDIAFQTNILALNAAVEAARAGAAGKGFAVVADEVRNLAGKSSVAAAQTAALIEESIKAVRNGTTISVETASSLNVVVEKSQQVVKLIDTIAAEAKEQAEAVKDINQSVTVISSVTTQNSNNAQESAAASEELNGQSSLLHQQISHFKFDKKR